MDEISKKFDEWATNGKAESMEKGHGGNVLKFLKNISFDQSFTFLDVGCGNGWVIRYVTEIPTCKKAVGIDKSKKMKSNNRWFNIGFRKENSIRFFIIFLLLMD